jgi:23S rRNA maturation mini-RNase III
VSFAFKTRAEQRLEWLEHVGRPLTDEESDILRRSMHAIYERNRRANALKMHEAEEAALLTRLQIEAQIPSTLS